MTGEPDDYWERQKKAIFKHKAWLMQLEAGSDVALRSRGGTYRFMKVTRVTATQIIVGTTKYRRKDGGEVGRIYGYSVLTEPTDEIQAETAKQELQHYIRYRLADEIKDMALTYPQMERLRDFVARLKAEKAD